MTQKFIEYAASQLDVSYFACIIYKNVASSSAEDAEQ